MSLPRGAPKNNARGQLMTLKRRVGELAVRLYCSFSLRCLRSPPRCSASPLSRSPFDVASAASLVNHKRVMTPSDTYTHPSHFLVVRASLVRLCFLFGLFILLVCSVFRCVIVGCVGDLLLSDWGRPRLITESPPRYQTERRGGITCGVGRQPCRVFAQPLCKPTPCRPEPAWSSCAVLQPLIELGTERHRVRWGHGGCEPGGACRVAGTCSSGLAVCQRW